ncbi:uncharacterized protein BJ171DRAFT_564305 [Polychytrium aggregatum]|uniref:uncharacterized protein n=1 Tax=Polychytrium aggregatum TaxID=110093 RepID=UPI0022FE404C|nr:uncharacterized protein BJ171DRAFT_564305 [Polychytrium aggregatum]KAI9209800.1 hypothetical protein BJ171DRAFT_564305 [Polychytrium aggregatum]
MVRIKALKSGEAEAYLPPSSTALSNRTRARTQTTNSFTSSRSFPNGLGGGLSANSSVSTSGGMAMNTGMNMSMNMSTSTSTNMNMNMSTGAAPVSAASSGSSFHGSLSLERRASSQGRPTDHSHSPMSYGHGNKTALIELQALARLHPEVLGSTASDPDLLQQMYDLALDCGTEELSEDVREALNNLSKEKKIQLIKQFVHSDAAACTAFASDQAEKSPKYYVDLLHSQTSLILLKFGTNRAGQLMSLVANWSMNPSGYRLQSSLKDILADLKMQCTYRSVGWLFDFVEHGGIQALVDLLGAFHKKTDRCLTHGHCRFFVISKAKYIDNEHEVLKILKLLANNKRGIEELLSNPHIAKTLILPLDSPTLLSRVYTTDLLLAIVTLEYPRGHQMVMGGFETLRQFRGDKLVFQRFVAMLEDIVMSRGLWGSNVGAKFDEIEGLSLSLGDKRKEQLQREVNDYLISTISLIRYLVQVPPELEYRVYIRSQLLAAGFGRITKKLHTWAASEFSGIMLHLQVIQDQFLLDQDTLFDQSVEGPDRSSPVAVLKEISETVGTKDQETLEYLHSIMTSLLVTAKMTDESIRSDYFRIIDNVVSQVVLDGCSFSPSFTDTYKISVQELIEGFAELREMNAVRSKLKELEERNESAEAERQRWVKKTDTEYAIQSASLREELLDKEATVNTLLKAIHDLSDKYERFVLSHEKALQQISHEIEHFQVESPSLIDSGSSSTVCVSEPAGSANTREASVSASVDAVQTGISSDTDASTAPGNGGTLPLPPPPPPPGFSGTFAALAPAIPRRVQKCFPANDLKRLQWEKLPESAVSKTIWARKLKLQTQVLALADSLENTMQELGIFRDIEQEFAAKAKAAKKGTVSSNKEVMLGAESTEICLIDGKRAQNIMIMLGSLRQFSPAELCRAINQFDETPFTEAVIKQFMSFVPTEDEIQLLKPYEGTGKPLRKSEEFLLELMKVDSLEIKLQAMRLKLTFSERFSSSFEDLSTVLKALKELHDAEQFPKVLELILTIGNFMNSGSFNGQIHGFKIASLGKLVDTKSADGKSTLLHFVVKIIDRDFRSLASFYEELPSVTVAARVCYSTTKDDLADLQQSLEYISLRSGFETETNEADSKIESFISQCRTELDRAQECIVELDRRFSELTALYGEDTSRIKIEDFLQIFASFVSSFQSARNENRKEAERIETEQRQKKRQEAGERELARKARLHSGPQFVPQVKIEDIGEYPATTSELDPAQGNPRDGEAAAPLNDFIESLKRGSIFEECGSKPSLGVASGLAAKRLPVSRMQHSSKRQSSTTSIVGLKALEMLTRLRLADNEAPGAPPSAAPPKIVGTAEFLESPA